jgi:hypothetical protein
MNAYYFTAQPFTKYHVQTQICKVTKEHKATKIIQELNAAGRTMSPKYTRTQTLIKHFYYFFFPHILLNVLLCFNTCLNERTVLTVERVISWDFRNNIKLSIAAQHEQRTAYKCFNPLKTKFNINYIYIPLVPRSKHTPSQLYKPVS